MTAAGTPLSELIYRAVLSCYPVDFRRELGPDLVHEFRAARRAALRLGGRPAALMLARTEIVDAVRNITREWRQPSRIPRRQRPPRGPGQRLRAALDALTRAVIAVWRQPRMALPVVAIIAIGFAGVVTLYSVVDTVVLEPLAYPEADRLVHVTESFRVDQTKSVSYLNFQDWRAMNDSFVDMGARTWSSYTLTRAGEAKKVDALLMSDELLSVLGVTPTIGRSLRSGDEGRAILISQRMWRDDLESRVDVVGSSLTLDGESYSVVGVMPGGLEYPLRGADVYASLAELSENDRTSRGSHPGMTVFARLREDVELTQARADLDRVAATLATQYPDTNTDAGARLTALHEFTVGAERPTLLALLGGSLLLLFGVCVNLANLMLARAAGRGRETAVHVALGAGRGAVAARMLLESSVLAVLGGGLGLALASAVVGTLRRSGFAELPRLERLTLDGSVAVFAAGLIAAVTLALGLLPALQALRTDHGAALRGSRGNTGGAGGTRRGLVVVEIALAVLLVFGAGLMVRTVNNLYATDLGFDPTNVLTARVGAPQSSYPDNAARHRLYDELVRRIRGLPGVEAASTIDPLPLSGSGRQWSIDQEGFADLDENGLRTDVFNADPEFFRTLGIRLIEGRTFDGTETAEAAGVVIDDSLAQRLWPDGSAIGQRFRFRGRPEWNTVVGVVEHIKVRGPAGESRVQLYFPSHVLTFAINLVVRTSGDSTPLAEAMRAQLAELDPQLPLTDVQRLDDMLTGSIGAQSAVARTFSAFGAAALVLALVGLYGLASYSAAARTREIGIRMALGADRSRVLRTMAAETLGLAGVGVVLGGALSVALGRTVATLLYGVTPADPVTLAGAAGSVALVAFVASWIPAQRASRSSPLVALRAE